MGRHETVPWRGKCVPSGPTQPCFPDVKVSTRVVRPRCLPACLPARPPYCSGSSRYVSPPSSASLCPGAGGPQDSLRSPAEPRAAPARAGAQGARHVRSARHRPVRIHLGGACLAAHARQQPADGAEEREHRCRLARRCAARRGRARYHLARRARDERETGELTPGGCRPVGSRLDSRLALALARRRRVWRRDGRRAVWLSRVYGDSAGTLVGVSRIGSVPVGARVPCVAVVGARSVPARM